MIRSLEPDGLHVLTDCPRVHRAPLNWFPLVLSLTLVLLAVAGCARIKNPEGWAGGVVEGDTLYIGSAEGELVALDRSSGERLWIFELQGEESERAIYGTPAVVQHIDPDAVATAKEAGMGATIDVEVGGKADPMLGPRSN